MEQINQETAGAEMNAGADKKSSGMKYGMIVCAILAVAGIGFGVYEMLQANKAKQQISELKIEVKNTDGTTAIVETDKIEIKEDNKTIVIADSTTVSKRESGYLYLDEYGIKVKLPEDFVLTGYRFVSDVQDWGDAGVSKYNIYGGSRDAYITPEAHADYPLITIMKIVKDKYVCNASCGEEIYSDDAYMYRVFVRNAAIAERDGSINEELNGVVSSKLYNWYNSAFSQSENYSSI